MLKLISAFFISVCFFSFQKTNFIFQNPLPVHISKLPGGATNNNYLLEWNHIRYFLRLGGDVGYLGLALEKEYAISKAVSQLGIAPKPLLFLPDKKVMVSEFIEEKKKPTMQEAVGSIAQLHKSNLAFFWKSSPFAIIDDYLFKLDQAEVILPALVMKEIIPAVRKLQFLLPLEFCPCHLDLHKGNMIDDGEKVWLIDWEYAAMSDPYFDLAVWASADQFSDDKMKELLNFYQGQSDEPTFAVLYCMRILADTRWMLWSFLQNKMSTITDYPYKTWASMFFKEALLRVSSPQFKQYLTLLQTHLNDELVVINGR